MGDIRKREREMGEGREHAREQVRESKQAREREREREKERLSGYQLSGFRVALLPMINILNTLLLQ
jgi:hypothetical protein